MKFKPEQICDPNIDFETICSQVYDWQLANNWVYRSYLDHASNLKLNKGYDFTGSQSIALIPIEVFRDTQLYLFKEETAEITFTSSGTTGMIRSEHRVRYKLQYEQSIWNGLKLFYPIDEFVFLGYTPGYLDNPNSSLIWMINYMISKDSTGLSRFLTIGEPVSTDLISLIVDSGKRIMLFGAAFGLLDMVESKSAQLPEDSLIMETGGMKTHRMEVSRHELHTRLATGFALSPSQIHSEYGMTELLSQAYSRGDSWFESPPWMKVSIRNPENPLQIQPPGVPGLIGVIDLANWASCPFLLTGDRGIQAHDGRFQVLGRWNSHHLRGCNYLLEQD
jgi:hypothetical protein